MDCLPLPRHHSAAPPERASQQTGCFPRRPHKFVGKTPNARSLLSAHLPRLWRCSTTSNMPAVPELLNAIAQLGNLAPRTPGSDSLLGREPAIDLAALAQDAPRPAPIAKRQQMVIQQGIIPTYYNLSGPEPGTVVGIVLGSVGGFLLVVWLLYSLTNANKTGTTTAMAGEEEIVVRRPRRNSHGNRSRRNSHAQMREVSRSPRQSSGRSHIIVEERRGGAPPPPRTRSIIVEERRRVPNDDVVEVIEEHEDYRERRNSRRGYR